MDTKDKDKESQPHYICLGECKGVSETPGVCKTPNCINQNHELEKCDCTDGLHNDFKLKL